MRLVAFAALYLVVGAMTTSIVYWSLITFDTLFRLPG